MRDPEHKTQGLNLGFREAEEVRVTGAGEGGAGGYGAARSNCKCTDPRSYSAAQDYSSELWREATARLASH